VVFSTVCVTLATLGHALTSTVAVPVPAIAVGFGLVLAVTLVLAGHERSLATILGGLLGGQFALHSLYAAVTGPALQVSGPGPGTVGHHAVAAMPGHESGLTMTLAHVAAAIVSAWWLRRGERAAWSLARRIADLADRPVRALFAFLVEVEPPAAPARTTLVPAVGETSTVGLVLRHMLVRRGPPTRSRALAHG
jgi:hypothetical protein